MPPWAQDTAVRSGDADEAEQDSLAADAAGPVYFEFVDSASAGKYTPKHLAEKILTSKSALEGERKQVTVLFADLKGSMELLAERDPEEARRLLDPVLERMMEAVDGGIGVLRAKIQGGANNWDVVQVESEELLLGCEEGLFEKIDWTKLAGRDRVL